MKTTELFVILTKLEVLVGQLDVGSYLRKDKNDEEISKFVLPPLNQAIGQLARIIASML